MDKYPSGNVHHGFSIFALVKDRIRLTVSLEYSEWGFTATSWNMAWQHWAILGRAKGVGRVSS